VRREGDLGGSGGAVNVNRVWDRGILWPNYTRS